MDEANMTFTVARSWVLALAVTAVGTLSLVSGCVSEDEPGDATGGKSNGTGGGGGASGSTGTGGSGGGGGASGDPLAVACPTPKAALITDFSTPNADGKSLSFGNYTDEFSGALFQYPETLVADYSKGDWHITGTVNNYAGVGATLMVNVPNPADATMPVATVCTKFDASAYKGISFKVSGTVPGGESMNTLYVWVSTAANDIASAWKNAHKDPPTEPDEHNFGRCIPASSNQYDGTCQNAEKAFPVSATPTTVTVLWTDMAALGKPTMGLAPHELVAFGFRLPNPTAVGMPAVVPYEVDITIDDLKFVE
jgi:hypothetical protein